MSNPNHSLRGGVGMMSHTSEQLLDDNQATYKSVPASPKKSRDNQLEPNDFFGDDKNHDGHDE